jgi:DNA mismatch repair protein MutL
MADIIRLLPDAVANQIAAGEVIQRPASAVKELLENAVDAGASRIQLILRDAGKSLIQVIDDGSGMTETDARLSFERHATSKIRKSDDLYTLHTMGFRGEALASIAAVAQVELKTRMRGSDIGTKVIIEASEVKGQEPVAVPEGTSISVKNLFYNVPARRNFLKSDTVESRHLHEEFIRVSLSYPHIHFTMHHNGHQVFDLRGGNFRQRIAAIFGNNYNERLVPIEEETSIVKLEGFVGKPEFAKKSRGEQYFFVNHRFIKDNYLHHAISSAYESLITKDSYSSYWLNITVDPATIDVNIHPTKTEIKFIDDKNVYAILRAAAKRALGKFSIAPSLDFDQERAFDLPLDKLNSIPVQPTIKVNPNYNPFNTSSNSAAGPATPRTNWGRIEPRRAQDWLQMHDDLKKTSEEFTPERNQMAAAPIKEMFATDDHGISLLSIFDDLDDFRFVQVSPRMMSVAYSHGFVLIDIQGAHERIMYERYLHALETKAVATQQQLFPPQLQLSPADAALVVEINEDLRKIGFDLSDFGNNTVVVNGIPAELEAGLESQVLQMLFEQYRNNRDRLQLQGHDNLARSMARSIAVKMGRKLASRELKQLAMDLLHCETANYGVNGKLLIKQFGAEDIYNLLQH